MRILYINYASPGTGAWVHKQQFALAMKALNPDMTVHPLLQGRENDSSIANAGSRNRPSIRFRGMRLLAALFIKKIIEEAWVLNNVKPDVVILRAGRYLSSMLFTRYKRIPVLLEINGSLVLENRLLENQYRLKFELFWRWLEKRVLMMGSHLMVVSEPLRQHYINWGFTPGKITTVPNGVDIQIFHPDIDGLKVRKNFCLEGKIAIGFSGAFSAWHGLDFLLQMIQPLFGERDDIMLLLVGRAKHDFTLPRLTEDRVIMTGFVPYDQMPEHLAAVDIFIAPYPRIEPFYFSPLKIFEAMAMGKAVLASSQGQIRELITDGVDGLLYPPGDKAIFLKKLRLLIANTELRKKLGKGARRKIEQQFTWRHNAQSVMELCRNLT
jgi:glycosyltransferase involved in cell wall biosynthesis